MKGASTIIVLLGAFVLLFALSTPSGEPESILLIVREDMSLGDIGRTLQDTSVIGHRFLFTAAFWLHSSVDIEPGGYRLTERMGSWRTVKVLIGDAQLRWVTIPEGLRKEEVAGIVGTVLEWTVVQQQRFIAAYQSGVYAEGVYFPDTYLIPHDATGGEVAERMIARLNEVLELYTEELLVQNIKWTTVLKLASLIQREAANDEEMSLIAGILWNRLLQDMRLQVDATVQYVRGDTGNGWWAPIHIKDKNIDSPYNTYLYKGLPPAPIANPGLAAIEAVIYPEETNCLYYIHDDNRRIHCSATYKEHIRNIERYLKN